MNAKFFHKDPKAPTPNRPIGVGALALIENESKLLMELRSDCERWGFVGGAVEAHESVEAALRREVFEETGLTAGRCELFGVFSDPSRIIEYPDGNIVRLISFVYRVEVESFEPLRTSEESLEFRFFDKDSLRTLDIVETARPVIEAYLSPDGKRPIFLDRRREMSLSKTLWKENEDLARAALEGSFVKGVGDGTLRRSSFEYYVAQDAFFLEAFARAYALALARSPDREGLSSFASLVSGVMEELELHAGYAKKWNVDLTHVEPGEATLAYTDFLLATASRSSVGETCAAMTPCMRLYAFLGKELAREGASEDNPYKEWIETYSDPGFEELAKTLENLLDRYAEDCPSARLAYRRAMRLEVGFFEAANDTNGGEGGE